MCGCEISIIGSFQAEMTGRKVMSSITKNWTEEDFRRELRRLDLHVKKTQGIDLVGSELDIIFSERATRTLGVYYGKEKKFSFSLQFFNSDVPEACAIDVIRHEYAHYYNHVVFGKFGHGYHFKVSCQIVGANPNTYYSRSFEKFARKREEVSTKTYNSNLRKGNTVLHPVYGEGRIVSVDNKRLTALLTIDFGENGKKVIDEVWLRKNGAV